MGNSKWLGGGGVVKFWNIYRKYPCLWDPTSPEYLKRDVKKCAFRDVIKELEDAGLLLQEEDQSVIRDAYRNELNKIKKSKNSGASTENVYKPKLMWFSVADSFLNSVLSCRISSSNLLYFDKTLLMYDFNSRLFVILCAITLLLSGFDHTRKGKEWVTEVYKTGSDDKKVINPPSFTACNVCGEVRPFQADVAN
ncbi:hypothetical protein FQA39_LY00601 [Lamprigera yunnana]|nr:hypothetical protein FQA39_LY00601 [Lamprigera yunnana]